jgi:glycosyltransferase involved in cell wall biosynthesis
VEVQAEGLRKEEVDVHYFEIQGKGLGGYLKNTIRLRRFLRKEIFDVVHAHYGLSGIAASLARAKNLVVTIMGSEVYLSWWVLLLMRVYARFIWSCVLVQSVAMQKRLKSSKCRVLPNGVEIDLFRSISPADAKKKLGYNLGKHVIWVSDPARDVKNYKLAQAAMVSLNDQDVHLHVVHNRPHNELPDYFRGADALLLTSRWEGSPIVIKEALAAGLPIVSTDVGDVAERIEGVAGCYLAASAPESLAEGLRMALAFEGRTDGHKNLDQLSLQDFSCALKRIYQEVMDQRQ